MKTKPFKSKDIKSLQNKADNFKRTNDIVIVNESLFFDRINEDHVLVISYH